MEHRLIQGGEQFLPFARSCITKLKRLGLPYADQSYEVDGCSIKVRIEPGHEYIRIEGGGGYASVFPTVQIPDTSTSAVQGPVPGATTTTGSFPATPTPVGHLEDWYGGKTWFGTTSYGTHNIRMARSTYEPHTAHADRVGSIQHSAIFVNSAKHEEVTRSDVFTGTYATEVVRRAPDGSYLGSSGTAGYAWVTGRTEMAHCTNSSPLAVLATLEVDTTSRVGTAMYSTSGLEFPEDGAGDFSENATRSVGSSFVKVRTLTAKGELAALQVARLGYEYASGARVDGPAGGDGVYLDTFATISNDFKCTWNHRRWHALDRTSVSPKGVIFVLRETNRVDRHAKVPTWSPPGGDAAFTTYSNSVTRGYSLSFVTSTGGVHDHVASVDIGRHGYIEAVIPSADDKKVYVYYGVHDSAYPVEDTLYTFDVRAPVSYLEKLDEYTVGVTDSGEYSVAYSKTIDLGAVTLRSWDPLRPQLDHYESKLHGASLEVKGFIWSDRFCYELARNAFYPIPNYDELVPDVYHGEVNTDRDQITGPRNDRTSYLVTETDGKGAVYLLIGFSTVRKYTLSVPDDTGNRSISLAWSKTISGGYSVAELLSATSVKFRRPT